MADRELDVHLDLEGETRLVGRLWASAVLAWRDVASRNGLTGAQIKRMESAFEHEDLVKAEA